MPQVRLKQSDVPDLGPGKWRDIHPDAPTGFNLVVKKDGRRYFALFFRDQRGRDREITIGKPTDALATVRKLAREARTKVENGIDPKPSKQAATVAAEGPKVITVWDDCLTWVEHEEGTWSPSYRETVKGWMDYDIGNPEAEARKPHWCGHLETTALTPRVLAELFYRKGDKQSIWLTKNETCQRVISILKRAINHAIANDDDKRFGEDWTNPVLALRSRLPKGKRPDPVSRRTVPYEKARAYYQRVEALVTAGETETHRMAAIALLTMIETLAPRAAEVLNMTWGEIELQYKRFGAAWLIPAGKRGRVKNKRNDRTQRDIPLLACTLERLNSIRPADAKPTDYVFRGKALGGKRLGHQQMRYLMKTLAAEFGIDATPHGWRTTTKTFVKEGLDDALRHINDKEAVEIAHDRITETAAGDRYLDTTLMIDRRRLAGYLVDYLRGKPDLKLVVDNDAVTEAA